MHKKNLTDASQIYHDRKPGDSFKADDRHFFNLKCYLIIMFIIFNYSIHKQIPSKQSNPIQQAHGPNSLEYIALVSNYVSIHTPLISAQI